MPSTINIHITDGFNPLSDVTVTIFVEKLGVDEPTIIDRMAPAGVLSYTYDDTERLIAALVVPRGENWPMVLSSPFTENMVAVCPPLPTAGPIAWWHRAIGQANYDPLAGSGIRVGVVDTGLADHVALKHAFCIDVATGAPGATLVDRSGHGTHVVGLIAGRPVDQGRYCGVAPGATVLMAGVFNHEEKASTRDIADAIEALALDCEVDLINLSLGGMKRSEVVLDAIRKAYDNGCLCIAAAGNDGALVHYPARFAEVVAVSALGNLDWAPPGSHASTYVPRDKAHFGPDRLYVATFSSRGDEVTSTAPGVGLISCLPNGGMPSQLYASMSGTSMAAPILTGALAWRLSMDKAYSAMPRDANRARKAFEIFGQSLRDLGLPRELQGGGMPA